MSRNRAEDTGPEVALRRALWAAGLRNYRLHPRGVPGRPDISFPRTKLALFIHGCFWHGCPEHGHKPKANSAFWAEKFARNQARDARKVTELETADWHVLTIWEHEVEQDVSAVVRRIQRALRGR